MRRSHRLAFPLFFLCPAAAALASDVELIKENGQWIQRDSMGGNYVVNPDVISLRWRAPIETQDQLITHLNTEQNPLVESVSLLNTLRTNRLGISDLQLAEGQDPVEMVAALEATGLFEFVTVNTFGEWIGVPNDAQYPNQYALNNTGQTGGSSGADIGAEDMWDIETGDPSVRIAVLDSGTDIFHPDLAPNRWEKLADPINGVDDDANGFIDDFYGWDFGDGDNDVVSSSFHGTFVAGIVAARTDNGIGISGVAGGFGANDGCTIMPVPVGSSFPDGSILDDAILYAADEGARIITLSLSVGPSAAIDAAVTSATIGSGVWINNASGNSGGSNNVGYPAYLPEITAVGSTNDNGAVSGFSSGGPQVFICAPGEEVLSTNLGNGYGISSGTSFASPHIAGIVGLMISANPGITRTEIADILQDTAIDIGASGFDVRAGWGRVDAAAAVAEAATGCSISNTCTSVPNSTGLSAMIDFTGSASVSANNLALSADPVAPNQNGIFFYGPGEQQVPFGSGFLCVTSPMQRLPIINSGIFGIASYTVDLTNPPQASGQINAGSTWSFQYWYRDPAGGGAAFNTSDALTVTFCP